jgi:hypothetical protein
MRPTTPGNWREMPFQYTLETSLTVPTNIGAGEISQDYIVPIFNYDFILRRILIVNNADASFNPNGAASGQSLLYLRDAAQRGLSNIPLPDYFFAWNSGRFPNLFPVPELIYPNGSNIYLSVLNPSMVEAEGPATRQVSQTITFDGAWRIPCL